MISPRRIVSGYPELIAVLIAAVLGLTVRTPLAWVANHRGIDVLLALLVFATAVTIEASALRRVSRAWRLLLAAVAVGVTVLPTLSWAVSRLVPSGSLRDGVLTVGLAPCEIASVATTAMAGGEAALAAGALIGSTAATIVLAGPILGLLAGQSDVHPGGIVLSLALVVGAPLAVGLCLRTVVPFGERSQRAAAVTATASVVALAAVIVSEVHLSVHYLSVAGGLALFLAGSAVVGRLLGSKADRGAADALLLTTSMRDFAIAAGLATTAFGPGAAGPLGLYGILVLIWGTAAAGWLRSRRS